MARDLTVGKPSKVLIKLTLPMFVSVIFQQLYSLADSVIAGRFAGENALAAVGASFPITMIFMAVAFGFNVGCSILISQLFGAKEYGKTKTAIMTTLISALTLSIILLIAGLCLSAQMLLLIKTPADIFIDAEIYLQVYVGGLVFLFLYNATTAVFTALGDTRTPLVFLIGSSLLNIILDYVFVRYAHWGVAGVAWATFIAQGLASVASLIMLVVSVKKIKSEPYSKFSLPMLKKIAQFALPGIFQQSSISIGNLCIQSIINSYGSAVIAGFSASAKLNSFAITCLLNLANGLSTYTAQNTGAHDTQRIKQGAKISLVYIAVMCVPFIMAFTLCGKFMINIFATNLSADALDTGKNMLFIISPFYLILSIKMVTDAVLRGAGKISMYMLGTMTDLGVRVALSFILSPIMGVYGVYWAWAIGWIVGTVVSVIFYKTGRWKGKPEPNDSLRLQRRT